MLPAENAPDQADGSNAEPDAPQASESPSVSPSVLAAAARGDGAAWRTIVALYGRRVYALAKSRCRDVDVAEEITQSVFATVATKFGSGQYEEQGRFEAWLFRVVMNRVRDHVRRHKRRPDGLSGGSTEGMLASAPARLEQEPSFSQGMLARLRRAMDQLSDADREIVELRHHGGMSFKQMADMLGEPVGTLLARHHRALRKLRDVMEPDRNKETGDSHEDAADDEVRR